MSVKFADKPCSERMAIVQSCQVQMIKNLEVVGAFSAKNFFPEKIIFDDLPPPSPKKFRSVYHFRQAVVALRPQCIIFGFSSRWRIRKRKTGKF